MKKIIIFTIISLLLLACQKEQGIEELDLSQINFDLSTMKMDVITSFDRNNHELVNLIKQLNEELFEMEIEKNISKSGNYFSGYDLTITPTQYLVKPIIGANPINPYGDDKKCGGQEGDGWKSFGTCINQGCVENKLAEAAEELGGDLGNGDCLDLRVKRNALNARVCGRVISC